MKNILFWIIFSGKQERGAHSTFTILSHTKQAIVEYKEQCDG